MRIAVTGATGFLGTHLVARLLREGAHVRVLTRRPEGAERLGSVEIVKGDLRDRDSLQRLLDGAGTFVHLAYPEDVGEEENAAIAHAIADQVLSCGVARMIHVSTAVVVGAVGDAVIDEDTRPKPRTSYERGKLRIEEILIERIGDKSDLTILRPTSIFGAGGQGLLKLISDLRNDRTMIAAIRRALLRSRKLNLVAVENVVQAIWFAATTPRGALRGRYIVSDGDDPQNNFGDVTAMFAQRFGLRVPAVPSLTPLVAPLLRLRGRSLWNPYSVFTSRKLRAAGFRPAISLREALDRFATSS